MIDNYTDTVTQFFLGAVGAGVRVAIGHEKGEKQGKAKIFSTVIAGMVLAGTSANALTEYAGVPEGFKGGIGFMVGILGIGFIYQVLDGKIIIPVISRLFKGDDTCKR